MVQSMVSMWSVNTFPKASLFTGGFGFISERAACRTSSRELSNSDVDTVDWHLNIACDVDNSYFDQHIALHNYYKGEQYKLAIFRVLHKIISQLLSFC